MLLNFAAAMASYSALGQQTPDVADQSSTVDEQESSDEHQLTNPSPADLRPHIHSPTSSGGGQVASSSSSDERIEATTQGTKRKPSEVEEGLYAFVFLLATSMSYQLGSCLSGSKLLESCNPDRGTFRALLVEP